MTFKKKSPLTLLCILLLSIGAYAQLPDGQSPGGKSWADSYQANGLCWCDTTFDHDLDDIDQVSFVINGIKRNIRDVCDELQYHPLVRDYVEGDPIYNDIQCGNGPANTAVDETQCPGRVDLGRDGCLEIGPQWDTEWLESRARFGGTEIPTTFIPDPNKLYYIDAAHHNVRLGATGESEDAYTTDVNTTGSDVEWKFIAKGNGYWHIQRAAGGTKPRLRTDNSANADMQETTSSGTYTYYEITTGDIANSYFLTLPNSPIAYNRLQINNNLDVKMVPSAQHTGTWESFKITEVESTIGSDIRLEAEDFDGMSGIRTEVSSESGDNVGYINNNDWLRFDAINLSGISNMNARVSSRFTGGTIEIRTGSTSGALIGSISVSNTGGDQNWTTLNTSISNTTGIQDVYLVFTGGSGYLFNINWLEFKVSVLDNKNSTNNKTVLDSSDVIIYPNPINSITTIKNAANEVLHVYAFNGRLVLTKNITSNSEVVDLRCLTTGIYYAKINSKDVKSVIEIIKK